MKNQKYMRKGLYLCISNEVYSNLSNKTNNGKTKISMLHLTNINNQEFYCKLLHYRVKSYDSTKAN